MSPIMRNCAISTVHAERRIALRLTTLFLSCENFIEILPSCTLLLVLSTGCDDDTGRDLAINEGRLELGPLSWISA